MASNCTEWTTETHTSGGTGPCTCRGTNYQQSNNYYMSDRNYRATTLGGASDSFRFILYL